MSDFRKFRIKAGSHRDRGLDPNGPFQDGKIRMFVKGQVYAHRSDLSALFPEKFEEVASDVEMSYTKAVALKKTPEDRFPAPVIPPVEEVVPPPEPLPTTSTYTEEDGEEDGDEEEAPKPVKKFKVKKVKK